jgi:hypothetical protein
MRFGMARFAVIAAALTVFSNCSGSSGTARSDAGRDAASAVDEGSAVDRSDEGSPVDHSVDAAAQGTPYACAAGFIVTADGGEIAVPDAGPPATCVVGQSYCYIALPRPGGTGEAVAACRAFVPGTVPAPCAQDPSCACFCDFSRGQVPCVDQCRCSEVNGFATVSCQGI